MKVFKILQILLGSTSKTKTSNLLIHDYYMLEVLHNLYKCVQELVFKELFDLGSSAPLFFFKYDN